MIVPYLIVLLIALHTVIGAMIPELSISHYLVLATFIVAAPVAGILAGAWWERFALSSRVGAPTLRLIAALLAWYILLNSPQLFRYLEGTLAVVQGASPLRMLPLFAAVVNGILLCAAVVAFALMFVVLLFEVPARWFLAANEVREVIPFAALRPLLLLIVLCMGFDLIVGFFSAELLPAHIPG